MQSLKTHGTITTNPLLALYSNQELSMIFNYFYITTFGCVQIKNN